MKSAQLGPMFTAVAAQAWPCDPAAVTFIEAGPDRLTTASIGVLAATFAALAHEVVGHGSGCLAVGGHVTLLTSIYFKCAGGTPLTDAAGPLGSLALALIATAALRLTAPTTWSRLFFLSSSLICWGWLAGQMIYSAALNKDDWAFLTWSLHWSPLWRLAAVAVGSGIYIGAARALASCRVPSGLIMALFAGAASAALAGLLWAKAPMASALEGLAAVGAAPGILLLLAKRRQVDLRTVAPPSDRSWLWIIAAGVTYALFMAGPSRGMGSLS